MADLSDVLAQLASVISKVVYPTGTGNPSIINAGVRVYPGWPTSSLDADLANGIANISIFPAPGTQQNTTRYPLEWQETVRPVHSVTASIDDTGTIITLGGAISLPQNIAAIVNGEAFVYGCIEGDTLDSVATKLAALINAFTPATADGSVITIPGAKTLTVRIGGAGTAIKEIRRQRLGVQITFWCNSPTQRDALVKPVDAALAAIQFLTLPDDSAARLIYERTHYDDMPQKANVFRRDLFYSVEYATTVTAQKTEIIVIKAPFSGGQDPKAAPIVPLNF